MYKYYYYTDNEGRQCVKCVSHYAGKPVIGVAKCSPSDEYNEEMGRQIAKARCDFKVADKRQLRASRKLADAYSAFIAAETQMKRMQDYYRTSSYEMLHAEETLTMLEKRSYGEE